MAWIMVLLLCLISQLAKASLVAYDENGGFTELEDVPAAADFGPKVPREGITGRLRVAKPDIFGCAPLDLSAPGDEDYTDMESGLRPALPIVVLLSRSLPKDPAACSFATKVENARQAGAALVVVFDYMEEPLFHMQKTGGAPEPPARIPAVLVSQSSGRVLHWLTRAASDPRGPVVYVDNTDPYEQLFFSLNMTMVAVVTTFLLALLLCASLFLCSSERLLGRREAALRSTRPLSLAQAARLPEVVVAAGGDLEKDSCSICLEDYTVGEKLVRLTCAHVMHRACVLPWISERQRTCPLCKTEVVPPPPLRTPSSAASQANRSAARRAAAAAAAPRRASADAAAAAPANSGGSDVEGRTRLLSAPAQATHYGAV